MFMKDFIYDKVTLLNTGVFALSFMNIENMLKIVLLIVSIIYTLLKIKDYYYNKGKD